ncbi:hypothetical protein SAMN05216421_1886 [Halopseudomonas xinjiangensis]|uniref:Antibiotic biosynthesis monooxygenase n=1 Tax=Halopseudomonas xinjiangensis TaxID=487184 RepID=A0A1H1TVF2_9GAMM|nr:hypothetical protein SAMN05216421_1886 [Halopseudomonas xinjiangensis]
MPVLTMIEFPEVRKQTYEALGASLASGEVPGGIIFHSCGEVPGGWRIVDVWETQDEF